MRLPKLYEDKGCDGNSMMCHCVNVTMVSIVRLEVVENKM